jgi:hypothetical protein
MKTRSENETSANRDDIAKLAWQIWEREGRQTGRDLEHWLQAEREVLGRKNQASPTRSSPATAVAAPSRGAKKPIRLPDSTTKTVYNPVRL